jgi:hypothetical protein
MLARVDEDGTPAPNLVGVAEEEFDAMQQAVAARLVRGGPPADLDLGADFDALQAMNNGAIDFLLFREVGQHGIAWYDRTVLAFFAAYWAMKFGDDTDRACLEQWVVGADNERLAGFAEFWPFAAQLPDALLDPGQTRWHAVFDRYYTPPDQLGATGFRLQWHREMIYHSHDRMQSRSPQTIAEWRTLAVQLESKRGDPDRQAVFDEIKAGFHRCPRDPVDDRRPFWMGSPETEDGHAKVEQLHRVAVEPFGLHEFPVTNAQYELFDPGHARDRVSSEHGQPVAKVSFWDAWCCARWLGYRLPTEEEWEYACRAGTATPYNYGEAADFGRMNCFESKIGRTMVKGRFPANGWLLYDMHGNVWEWCDSRYTRLGLTRVARGGCWCNDGRDCRSAYRLRSWPGIRNVIIGFRLAAAPAVGAEPSRQVE